MPRETAVFLLGSNEIYEIAVFSVVVNGDCSTKLAVSDAGGVFSERQATIVRLQIISVFLFWGGETTITRVKWAFWLWG